MTREEELDWLCRLRSAIYVYMPKEWLIPMNNALDMAIKALEQESCNLDDAREDFMHDVYNTLDFLPTNNEANRIIDSFDRVTSGLKQDFCEDCISRADAKKYLSAPDANGDRVIYESDLDLLPTVQPKYNTSEWCHDCSEYDQVKHCCPRFNRVIRNAVEEVKKPKIGRWIEITNNRGTVIALRCSYCGKSPKHAIKSDWCPNCGAEMMNVPDINDGKLLEIPTGSESEE